MLEYPVPQGIPAVWRRGSDSNARAALLRPSAFQAAPLDLSGTSPIQLQQVCCYAKGSPVYRSRPSFWTATAQALAGAASYPLLSRWLLLSQRSCCKLGDGCEIRTHEALRLAGVQSRCNRPLCQPANLVATRRDSTPRSSSSPHGIPAGHANAATLVRAAATTAAPVSLPGLCAPYRAQAHSQF